MSNSVRAGGAAIGGNADTGRDLVGRDQHNHDLSGSAQVHVDAVHQEWITAQIAVITNQLAQVNQRLEKLDQIDEALVGNRLHSKRGLVEDVQRLWMVVIGILIFLAILGVIEVAQWVLLWRLIQGG